MDQEASTPPAIAIGALVRVPSSVASPGRPDGPDAPSPAVSRRSIVATLPDESGLISLVQDDLAPAPLGRLGRFLVAPMFNSVGVEVKEVEARASDAVPLFDFELEDHALAVAAAAGDAASLVATYKGYGDRLLRCDDCTCAISYYEAALHFVSSKFDEVGGTLVVRRGGHCVVAEVDCVEDDGRDDPRYDVTYPSGEEATVSRREVLLAVWTRDASLLQPRILLNLSRCLLRLADVDSTRGNASCVGERTTPPGATRRERYRRAAVLGCSIAIALCERRASGGADDDGDDDRAAEADTLADKARIVRSRAFVGLRKLPNAAADARRVLAGGTTNGREAQALLSEIKAIESHNKKVDKRLSKEVCRWVRAATSSSNGAGAMERMDGSMRRSG